ncbi:MAG TPA: GerMN domain-containing protein [Thermoanaerobaculia bacterium]|nr:GerMN domain-containing protein [Thermoanaerobaculia bacterium]
MRWCRCYRWIPLALLVVLSCNAGDTGTDLQAGTVTDRGRIYLIELEGGGVGSRRISCGDSAAAIEVPLERRQDALRGSIEALLALRETYDPRSGLYNALNASRLEVDRIDRSGAEAKIYLKGYLEIGGECDSPRVLAQLTETALQFPDVQRATFYLEGKPLSGLLSGKGQ